MKDIIIIGGGTAGLSAAIYACRAGKSVLVFEGLQFGGQIVPSPTVENYPGIATISGYEFAKGLYEQAKNLGAEFVMESVTGIEVENNQKIVKTDINAYECKAIIIATGTQNKKLGVAMEQELTGMGVSYCATCDGAFYKDRSVAVVGGGNTALEDALFLSNYCKEVYLIHRRDTFRGELHQVKQLEKKENVKFVLCSVVEKLLGEQELTGIVVRNTIDDEQKEIKVDGLFIAIGQTPQNQIFSGTLSMDDGGYIKAGEDCHTNIPGVFVAGDCRVKTVRQLTTAAADGAVSALEACKFIEEFY